MGPALYRPWGIPFSWEVPAQAPGPRLELKCAWASRALRMLSWNRLGSDCLEDLPGELSDKAGVAESVGAGARALCIWISPESSGSSEAGGAWPSLG